MITFKIPTTIVEAERRLDDVVRDIARIQLELSRRKIHDTSPDYMKWRTTAVAALNSRHSEARQLKAWLASQPGFRSHELARDMIVARRMLRRAIEVFEQFDPVDFSDAEKETIKSIKSFLASEEPPQTAADERA